MNMLCWFGEIGERKNWLLFCEAWCCEFNDSDSKFSSNVDPLEFVIGKVNMPEAAAELPFISIGCK